MTVFDAFEAGACVEETLRWCAEKMGGRLTAPVDEISSLLDDIQRKQVGLNGGGFGFDSSSGDGSGDGFNYGYCFGFGNGDGDGDGFGDGDGDGGIKT